MKQNIFVILSFLFLSITSAQNIKTISADTLYIAPDSVITSDSLIISVPDTIAADTSALFTIPEKIDTTIPLYQRPLSSASEFISHGNILKTDYKSVPDQLKLHSFSFIREYGLYGLPDDLILHGVNTVGINILQDGVQLNNRFFNSYNFNLVQSELIDSIEVINVPRAFLFGILNTPSSVNIIEKDFLSVSPYTRIKYYEGPFGQAMFDGIFNTLITKRLNLFLDVTNRKADESYKNTDFSVWLAAVKLKYLLSDKFNITALYNFADGESGLNGGIDVDSISRASNNIENILYNEITAPVFSLSGRQNYKQQRIKLKTFWKPVENFRSDFSFYYIYDRNETSGFNELTLFNRYQNYSFGLKSDHTYSISFFDINLHAGYEQNKIKLSSLNFLNDTTYLLTINELDGSSYLISPSASLYLFDSTFIPSFFMKYSSLKNFILTDDFNAFGYGVDLNYLREENYKFYFGYSSFENYSLSKMTHNLEIGAEAKYRNLTASVNLFSISGFVSPAVQANESSARYSDISGIGLKLKYNFWKILFENYSHYYFDYDKNALTYSFPKYNFDAGIYFKDTLFNSNLDLKAGFRFYFNDAGYDRNNFTEPIRSLLSDTNYRIDFTLSGVISKAAIIYFTWENLTGRNYFIIPFYPMPERNIRFGIAWEMFN